MRPGRSSKRAKTNTKTLVNWLDLPRDVLIQIFAKLETIDLLYTAQCVCSSWRAIAQDPQLYRVIDMRFPWRYCNVDCVYKMARLAIERSPGQLVEFSIDYLCTNEILYDLMKKAPRLKCLRIAKVNNVDKHCVVEVIQKLPLLEEVEFTLCSFCRFLWTPDDLIVTVGFSCRGLKSFGLNSPPEKLTPWQATEKRLNEIALAVAGNLNPRLQSLSLLGNSMNNDGLEAILQRFTELEYLDLRGCANLDLKGDLLKKCVGIKTLRLPNDSTEDCPWLVGYTSFGGAI